MNDSIKILEEIIEYCKEHLPPYYKDEDLQALENLIKRYRELKEENSGLKLDRRNLLNCIEAIKHTTPLNMVSNTDYYIQINDNFIPKSKIKEIRDKAEVMDYYTLPDVIDDLNKLLEV